MHTKITIAIVVAAMSLATAAFAAEGNGEPFPLRTGGVEVQLGARPDTGSARYQAYDPALSTAPLGMALLPSNGSNGAVETANSLPAGAMVGTAAYMEAQAVNRWFAQQDAHRFAALRANRPNG